MKIESVDPTMVKTDDLLLEEIKAEWTPADQRCAVLIHKRDSFIHYSVALSDKKAIAWGGHLHRYGFLVIHEIDNQFTDAQFVQHLGRDDIYCNILASVDAFHTKWNYGAGWNCEHWARLVTVGDPKSYQIAEACFGILNLFGLTWRGEAIAQLSKFREKYKVARAA